MFKLELSVLLAYV